MDEAVNQQARKKRKRLERAVLDAALQQRDVPHSEPSAYQTFQRMQQRLWDAIDELQRHVEQYGEDDGNRSI